jgi:hypothetical protein
LAAVAGQPLAHRVAHAEGHCDEFWDRASSLFSAMATKETLAANKLTKATTNFFDIYCPFAKRKNGQSNLMGSRRGGTPRLGGDVESRRIPKMARKVSAF